MIERYGSGIQRIIEACKKSDLPTPVFEERFGGFLVVFRRDFYTEKHLGKLGLNERQIKAVMYVKERGKITNKKFRELFKITDRTALTDLSTLCMKGIFEKIGKTGRKTEYILSRKTRNKPEINPKNEGYNND